MLIKAEKILTHGDVLLDKSEQEIFNIVRYELADKIVEKMIEGKYLKIEVTNTPEIGAKVRATVRVYNPDD